MVDPNGVKAAMNNGVLRLELPRAEEDKPRRIKVKAR
jgi:HSP20 family protein